MLTADGSGPGDWDVVLLQLDANGNHVSSHRHGGPGKSSAHVVKLDWADRILLGGDFEASIDIAGTALSAAGVADAFVAKLDQQANHLWSYAWGTSVATVADLDSDAIGNVFVVGAFYDIIDAGGAPLVGSANVPSVFLAKLGP